MMITSTFRRLALQGMAYGMVWYSLNRMMVAIIVTITECSSFSTQFQNPAKQLDFSQNSPNLRYDMVL